MTALFPLAFALLALALPMGLAYLWQKRTEKRKVSSVLILRRIAVPTEPPKRGFARPRHLASFALVLLGLVAATLGVADLRRSGEAPRDLVVVLDTSASMGAVEDGGQTRLDLAKQRLASALSALHSGDRVALISTGGSNVVRVGLTEDIAYVLEVARGLSAEGTSDASSSAIELADGICKSLSEGRILLLSDGVGVSVPKTECEVDHEPLGTDVPNAGISALSVREGDAFGTQEVHIEITSALKRKQRAEIAILAGDFVVDLAAIDLPANGKEERLLRLQLPEGAAVSAELRLPEADALAADDVATAPRVEGGKVKTLLVTAASKSFTSEALRLHPRVELTSVRVPQPIPADLSPDLVVLEALPEGGVPKGAKRVVTLGLPPAAVGLQEGQTLKAPDIVRWSYADPLFRYVDLQGVKVPTGTAITPRQGQRALIDVEQGALGLLDAQPERELLYFGFAPHESDFVLRVGFVNFMANVVEWASLASSVGERKGVLSSTESWLHPPKEGDDDGRKAPGRPLPIWRVAVLAALGLCASELLAQTVIGSRQGLLARLSSWRARRAKADATSTEEAP